MIEKCSCSATLTIDSASPTNEKAWRVFSEFVKDWRDNHRHDMPIGTPEAAVDIPYIHESGSSHERAPQYLSTENDIPFGFTRNA